ncbi:MAG: hypothetical protein AB8H80_12810 [Planctomycetota bacterium]
MVKTVEVASPGLARSVLPPSWPGTRHAGLLTLRVALLLAVACAGTSERRESAEPATAPTTTAGHGGSDSGSGSDSDDGAYGDGSTGQTSIDQAAATPDADGLHRACDALLAAQPGEWALQLLETVANGGERAAELLRDGLLDQPSAPGAQAAIAVLGRIGDAQSIAFCRQLILERATLATEAALALSHARIEANDDVLLRCMQDRHADATLRTACACALARAGNRAQAPELIEAIVRAGTAAGRADEQRLGLPGKPRWARERYFVQRLLEQLGHADLLQQLDSDAPWHVLEAVAPKIRARLEQKQS